MVITSGDKWKIISIERVKKKNIIPRGNNKRIKRKLGILWIWRSHWLIDCWYQWPPWPFRYRAWPPGPKAWVLLWALVNDSANFFCPQHEVLFWIVSQEWNYQQRVGSWMVGQEWDSVMLSPHQRVRLWIVGQEWNSVMLSTAKSWILNGRPRVRLCDVAPTPKCWTLDCRSNSATLWCNLFRNKTQANIHDICSCSLPSWFVDKNPAFCLFVFFSTGQNLIGKNLY